VASFFLDLIKEEVFLIGGQCQHSGKCCRSIMLYNQGVPINSITDWSEFLKKFPSYFSFKPNHESGHIVSYDCDALAGNRCGRYATRPLICQQYPHSFFLQHGYIHDTCGYFVTTNPLKFRWLFRSIKRQLFTDKKGDTLQQHQK
jgi:Fe-S-cluster containining protein